MVLESAVYPEAAGRGPSDWNLRAGHSAIRRTGGGQPSRVTPNTGRRPSAAALLHGAASAVAPPVSPTPLLKAGRYQQFMINRDHSNIPAPSSAWGHDACGLCKAGVWNAARTR